jgi:membrane-associated HD superfamily phosphohydrolase
VGKRAHPAMFVENQRGGNPHDALPPQESARLIIGHVAEGERLATTHRLGRRLQSFIREHHGTSVVRFFLERARTQGGDVDERDFRYGGPTPQSLESAVLMLADQVEATARSLPGADADALAAMVDRTIMRALEERQFDDAPIAPGQIRQVRDALVAALAGMRHQRVAYPESNRTTR